MLNLTKRINKLLEKTSSLECKNACKEIVEMFHSVPEEQLTASLVEKLNGIADADKHVKAFVKSATKRMKIRDLGVAKAISKIRESQVYHYPALRYSLDRFERAKVNEGVLDYLIVEDFLTSLKDFTWDKNVKDSLDEVREQFEADRELILVSKAIYEFKKGKGDFLFEKITQMLEDHFENPTDASRSAIIESLSKFGFSQVAKNLTENLKKIQSSTSKNNLQIMAENSNCQVSPAYSTIFLENGKEYFTVKGDLYKKVQESIEKVSPEEFNNLSENVKRSFQIMNSPHFFVKEGKASFYLGRNKIEISEGENSTQVLFNGKTIASTDIAKNLVSTGMIRLEEARVASDIQFVNDTFSNFYELDFVKVISSKMYEGSYVTLMKVNENIYLNKVNASMRSNEFFSGINATQARNLVLEFLGYDIKESLHEFIEKEEAEILAIKEQQIGLLKNMSVLEGELNKLEAAKNDSFIAAQPQIKSLLEMLNKELHALKGQYSTLSAKLKKFEAKSSDAGVEIGEDVKIIDTEEIATVTAIDSNTKKVSVVTSDGKTRELPISKIISVEKAEESAMQKNDEKSKTESEKEQVGKVEETQNMNAGGNEMPVENPNKDKFPPQEPESQLSKVENDNPEYVVGKVDSSQEGSCAGKDVEVLATDFAAKGPEDLIQVKCEGELYFIEKKFVQVSTSEEESLSIDFDAEAPSDEKPKKEEPKEEEPKEEKPAEEPKEEEPKEEKPAEEPKEEEPKEEEPKEEEPKEEKPAEETKEEEPKEEKLSIEDLQAKLSKALEDLEQIKNDMKDTFTSNETISTTINSLRGLNDALKKDNLSEASASEKKSMIRDLVKELEAAYGKKVVVEDIVITKRFCRASVVFEDGFEGFYEGESSYAVGGYIGTEKSQIAKGNEKQEEVRDILSDFCESCLD